MTTEEIGTRLKHLRVSANEIQQDVADDIGVRRETIKFWECGKRQIKATDLAKICKHFHVSADYILGLPLSQQEEELRRLKIVISNVYEILEKNYHAEN